MPPERCGRCGCGRERRIPRGVIAAGERWEGTDGRLRPAVEDLLGAGAIIARLPGTRSPEAAAASAAFEAQRSSLIDALRQSASGRELIGKGFPDDVEMAASLDVSDTAPVLIDGASSPAGARRLASVPRLQRSRSGRLLGLQ